MRTLLQRRHGAPIRAMPGRPARRGSRRLCRFREPGKRWTQAPRRTEWVPRPSRGGRTIHRPFIFVAQSCPEEKGGFVHITWRDDKEWRNIRKHGLDFSSAERVLVDPVSNTMPDRVVDGEERWHTIGAAVLGGAFKIVVVVH